MASSSASRSPTAPRTSRRPDGHENDRELCASCELRNHRRLESQFTIHNSQQLSSKSGLGDERPMSSSREPSIRVVMMPKDTNAHGTIFGGVILSYIDQAAAVEA